MLVLNITNITYGRKVGYKIEQEHFDEKVENISAEGHSKGNGSEMTNRKAVVEESASYDNFLDKQQRIKDEYKVTLEEFVGEEIEQALHDRTKASVSEKYKDIHKVVYVHFRNVDDIADFCSKIESSD